METRLATPKDAEALAALHSESFGDARWSAAQIADSLALESTQGWVAVDGGVVRGFVLCQITVDEAEILTFCIALEVRRKGIGATLLAKAMQAAQSQGTKRMFLEAAADNQAALALYEKAGFRKTGHRSGYYRHGGQVVDAVILSFPAYPFDSTAYYP